MNKIRKEFVLVLVLAFLSVNATCQDKTSSVTDSDKKIEKSDKKKKRKKHKLPNIDLSHWSVTTPALNEKGNATNVEPPEILSNNGQYQIFAYRIT